MPVRKFRSIEDMPPPWHDSSDPDNLRRVAGLAGFLRLADAGVPVRARLAPGVYRFRTIQEANAARGDWYRSEAPEVLEVWENALRSRGES